MILFLSVFDLTVKIYKLNPDKFHATGPFDIATGKSKKEKKNDYSKIFVKQLKLLNLDKELIDDAVLAFWSWDYLLNNDFKDGRVTMPEINRMYSNIYLYKWNKKDIME